MYAGMHTISKDIVDTLPSNGFSLKEAEHIFDERYLKHALKNNKNNIKSAANAIGVRYETLLRKMKKLGISV